MGRLTAAALAFGLSGCAGRTDATRDESLGEPKIETSTTTPESETDTNVGRIVLLNWNSTAHELDVVVKRY
ncbi:hypothetical protein [Haloprofundus salilacus]|uniref:hypothetical protein n=1 Tax=Haloprofundus salilacus TaxID=2876190 RepID=UPI001CC9C20F|nr:hypothetical protein [Haloprofundus salilacus]